MKAPSCATVTPPRKRSPCWPSGSTVPLLVVWEQRDAFDGEDEPPVAFDWPWPAAPPVAVDALGQAQPAEVLDGRVKLSVSLTPVFIAAD